MSVIRASGRNIEQTIGEQPANTSPRARTLGQALNTAPAGSGAMSADYLQWKNAEILRGKQDDYEQLYKPVEKNLASQLNDTRIVDSVEQDTPEQRRLARARSKRQLSRMGVQRTASQQEYADHTSSLRDALSFDDNMNNARLDQHERNVSLRNALINLGRGVDADASSSFADAANRATDRDNAYKTASAQHDAAEDQQNAQMAATAMMMVAMMV